MAKYTSKLQGSSVLIVGGTSGIGYGLAEALVEHGVEKLWISSSRAAKVDSAVQRLKTAYPEATTTTTITGLTCDLSDEATLEANVRNLISHIEKLDHIVFTAGDPLAPSQLSDVTVQSAVKVGMVRFFAPLMVAKYGSPLLTPGPASSITLTTGAAAEKPAEGWTVISSFASGLFGMVRGLALELRPVRVNLVSPGAVVTELWDALGPNKEAAMAEYAKKQATGRVGAVEDVVESYLFLMKDRNATGTVAKSDGGVFLM
ncbi:hypothetical protein A1O1_06193 [Capronia coronata CBS 617.96]|uniref:Uncharacterized protein n=1 Tax=Capronia coronata CBS 617.96 TaxID=1182541 RepID=W9YU69_9EURO|nr:uncharacterized protein A1O1_06193 [Capronia coronata CBS 617.96]EXJ85824.1 hypothetical protein A1O1_06193 [Capronia coronata CBS 617.96]